MRVAVTGAGGFIGRTLCAALREHGHHVLALDRDATGDIAAISDWPRRLEGAEAVVHLAALAHARGISGERLRAVNVDAALRLGEAAAAAGLRMLFMSTIKVLGEESTERPFDETSPRAPSDAYARAKAEAETRLGALPGLALETFRPPLVYGPGVRANFAALLGAVARGVPLPLAGIRNRRSLLYVGNLADAVVRALQAPRRPGALYLPADAAPVSTPQLCRALGEALGRPARLFSLPRALLELAPGGRRLTRSLEVRGQALERDLGWTPRATLEEGLRRTAAWYRGG
jgi:nucleoside-diphosphate-sugar epimerase